MLMMHAIWMKTFIPKILVGKRVNKKVGIKCFCIQGQGYDDINNIWGKWDGLQALFHKDCHFACYIHYLAHRL